MHNVALDMRDPDSPSISLPSSSSRNLNGKAFAHNKNELKLVILLFQLPVL